MTAFPEIDLSALRGAGGDIGSRVWEEASKPAFPEIDLSALHGVGGDEKAEEAARPIQEERLDETDWTTLRKAAPSNKLLDFTLRWAEGLPPEVRPHALMAKYPRIANMAAVSWKPQTAFRDYLDLLLVDRRGGRKGFSPEILAEFEGLRNYHFHGVTRVKSDQSFYRANR